ncbi:succinate dehydrogenase assembly factor 2 [Legionella fairfieldensis]|uniref:FAD assembly factor SdhE n=1 Tax=Legionella fairfieldensis TaxID=45064 RepID=UPI000AEAFF50|nr:succinate dehydrogenase assembly factor 2 [Legionella fairfieldensis]
MKTSKLAMVFNNDEKAKLKWHCRRGMLELDLILTRFADNNLNNMNEAQLTVFSKLLACTDPELFSWLMSYEKPADKELADFVEFIRLHDKLR